jgi:DnaJ-class molecular chaperone
MSKKTKKREPSGWCIRIPVPCDACEGTGKVWVLLKGANIQTTKPCCACWSSGTVVRTVRLSEEESRKIDDIAAAHGAP